MVEMFAAFETQGSFAHVPMTQPAYVVGWPVVAAG